MDSSNLNPVLQTLRSRAEQRRMVSASLPANAPPDMQQLVQELQVHQIELQMQYEELLVTQTAAEASRAQYLDLYEFAPVGYCTIDKAGTLLQLNLHMAQLVGTERQQLLARRLLLFVDREARPQFITFLAKLWTEPGQRLSCELAMRQQDETPFFVQVEGVVASADGRQPATCRLVLLDSTLRRQATDALAASEARFRGSFQQSRDGMLLLEDSRFVDVNEAGVRMLYRTDRRHVVGHHLSEFWPEHQPDGRRSMDVLTDCIAQAQADGWCRFEWMRQDAAGQPVWDEMSFDPMLVESRQLMHVVWRDITERKRLQLAEREQQQQRAEAVLTAEEREKRRIAESLHNGLAQQLYAAKLTLAQLQGQPCRDSPQAFAQAYQKTSQLLAAAIVQTRTLSHELIPRTLQDFGLVVALQDICTDYSIAPLRMRYHSATLPTGLPTYLLLALYRIAQELANNIVKHAQATEASLRLSVDEEALELCAWDNGVGLPANALAQPKGVGWQTMQDRVQLLNGTLELQSTHGTRITVRLPLPV